MAVVDFPIERTHTSVPPEALVALQAVKHAGESVRLALAAGTIEEPYRGALERLADLIESLTDTGAA
jgi:hypothetical protein